MNPYIDPFPKLRSKYIKKVASLRYHYQLLHTSKNSIYRLNKPCWLLLQTLSKCNSLPSFQLSHWPLPASMLPRLSIPETQRTTSLISTRRQPAARLSEVRSSPTLPLILAAPMLGVGHRAILWSTWGLDALVRIPFDTSSLEFDGRWDNVVADMFQSLFGVLLIASLSMALTTTSLLSWRILVPADANPMVGLLEPSLSMCFVKESQPSRSETNS
jgi:hypothetical protein